MVVPRNDPPGGAEARKLGGFGDWLVGQESSLYFAAGRDWKAARTRSKLHNAPTPRPSEQSRLVSPMRELERDSLPSPLNAAPLVVVGGGRVGGSLARAAEIAGVDVRLAGRGEAIEPGGAVLLCVPDDAIAEVCERIAASGPFLVGHVSGAGTLELLAAARERGASTFSLHPLQTFADDATAVDGTPAAIAGSDEAGISYARTLAETLAMR